MTSSEQMELDFTTTTRGQRNRAQTRVLRDLLSQRCGVGSWPVGGDRDASEAGASLERQMDRWMDGQFELGGSSDLAYHLMQLADWAARMGRVPTRDGAVRHLEAVARKRWSSMIDKEQ